MPLEERIEFGTARQEPIMDEDFSYPQGPDLKRVDLACGQRKKEGFIGIDRAQMEGVDILHDLFTFPWPFENNEIYEFRAEHFVEHLPMDINGRDGLFQFMEEVWRCLMPGGTIEIIAPYFMSRAAWQDPTHRRAITDLTFHYFMHEVMEVTKIEHYAPKCNFKLLSRTFVLYPAWEGRAPEAQNYARESYWNVVQEIRFVLRKADLPLRKGDEVVR
jgi:hypothetical protein